MSIRMQLDLNGLKKYSHNLDVFAKNAKNTLPLMQDIARYGETSTDIRFNTSTGPDGKKWAPSKRVIANPGEKTLIDTRRLKESFSSEATPDKARWGTNMPYAAIHNFGGVIRRKDKNKKFSIPGLNVRNGKGVIIPERPFMGINKADEQIIEGLIIDHLRQGVAL